jgi:hypothetical protein
MSTAHIIFCNDAAAVVIIDDLDKAESLIEPTARADFEKNKWQWLNQVYHKNPVTDEERLAKAFEHYRQICYWHIHSVRVI